MTFVDKWRPVFAPEAEVGSPEPTGSPPAGGDDRSEPGPGSGRSTLRQQLEKNFETDRKASETPERPDPNTGRTKTPKSRAREHMEAEGQTEPQEGQVETEETEQPATPAPTGWTAEAKAEWANVPAPVQAAVIKREQDMARGVEELKAKYGEIDRVLAPRMESMRRFGHKPHEAVGQLFAWFDALSANPDVAFPALAASFRYDLRRLLGAQQQPQTQQQPAQQQPAAPPAPEGEQLPPAVQQYIQQLHNEMNELKQGVQQQFGQLHNTFAQQSQAKTDDMLAQWARNKPHYEKVRTLMGKLIIGMQQDNSVPLLQNGSVDLDAVYDMALYASPEVRSEIFASQKATEEAERKKKADTERKAQNDQAEKARRAAGGIAPSAPGQQTPTKGARKGGKSVRDSLKEAMEELAQ